MFKIVYTCEYARAFICVLNRKIVGETTVVHSRDSDMVPRSVPTNE
jgi:hypothetical protein